MLQFKAESALVRDVKKLTHSVTLHCKCVADARPHQASGVEVRLGSEWHTTDTCLAMINTGSLSCHN